MQTRFYYREKKKSNRLKRKKTKSKPKYYNCKRSLLKTVKSQSKNLYPLFRESRKTFRWDRVSIRLFRPDSRGESLLRSKEKRKTNKKAK